MLRSLTIAAATLALAASPASAQKIQPGIELGMGCTANFIYDGVGPLAGKTYLGTAAHCVEKVGERVEDGSGAAIGTVAKFGNADMTEEDWAFIEIAADRLGDVDPAMKGHPDYPTGVTDEEETAVGDLVQMSGYGIGFGLTQPTQEQRQLVLQGDDNDIYWLSGPSVNGDSGGPFVHIKSGKALGIVSRYGFETASTDLGPTVEGLIRRAEQAGFPVQLRAVGQSVPVAPPPPPQGSPPPAQQPAQPSQPAQSSEKPKSARKKAKPRKKCRKVTRRTKSGRKVTRRVCKTVPRRKKR